MEDFIRFAISEGFSSYGISSHAPLPFSTAWTMEWDRMDDYLSEFARLKEKYADKIELAIGLEIDYLNEESHPAIPRFQELPAQLSDWFCAHALFSAGQSRGYRYPCRYIPSIDRCAF